MMQILDIEKKVTDHDHDRYITTSEFNNLTADKFTVRLAQAKKTDFDDKLIKINKKINSNETRHLLVENKLKKLQTFDSSYFRGKSHFVDNDGTHLVFSISTNRKIF